jgi:hypothetical protein
MNSSKGEQETAELNECLEVEIVMKELEVSYVGRLAVNAEVHRIRTCLFMEGLAHIAVTDIGRNMVLIHSPKVGEVARLWKGKVDWINYYFREVVPWAPSCFADKRDTWVKVYGIPLHVWGENLFKTIGRKYGEFLDFDNNTASRAKLDVACLKISTTFHGKIDDPVHIRALGVTYTLRVVEDKVMEHGFFHGERLQEEEGSWVESVNFPGVAREVDGGPKEEEVVGDDLQVHEDQMHGNSYLHDGDGTLTLGGKEQNLPFESVRMLEDELGKLVEKDNEGENIGADEVEINESHGKESVLGERVMQSVGVVNRVIEACPDGEDADFRCGPGYACGALNDMVTQSSETEPNQSSTKTRSGSLPSNRLPGSASKLGRFLNDGLDFSDTISLVEVRRGVDSWKDKEINSIPEAVSGGVARRGRSKKCKEKSKQPSHNMVGLPKFLKLGEALKDRGGRQRRKKKGDSELRASTAAAEAGEGCGSSEEETCSSKVPLSMEGLSLEVVLPAFLPTPNSGLALSRQGEYDGGISRQQASIPVSTKLLQIQHQVGFVYGVPDDEVVKILEHDEQRDRLKKEAWEQSKGFQ